MLRGGRRSLGRFFQLSRTGWRRESGCYPAPAVRIPIALYALALVARAVLVALYPDPAYPDSHYYVDVARALHATGRFEVDFIWIFAEVGGTIPANPTLPIPSNAHWMPLASIIQLPFFTLFGVAPSAAAAPFALVGSLAAPLTWAIARDAGARPLVAVGAGVLTALPALSLVFMTQPDNFSLYQPLVAAALWMAARGLRGDARAFALGGLFVGVATLSRNDGVLVGATLGLAFAWDRIRAWRSGGSRPPRIPLWSAVACFGLFLVAVGPWYLRQLAVFGQLSPSTASGKVLFIRDIGEWNSITTPATLSHLLGQGLGPLLESRVLGLVAAVGIYATLIAAGILVPFMLAGAWRRRRSADFGPFLTYATILFLFSAIVSAIHVPGGTFIHSAVALAPHSYILALEAIVAAVGWMAVRRRTWDREAASRVFVGATVGFAALAAVGTALVVHEGWAAKRDRYRAIATALDEAGAPRTDRVMSIDSSGMRYHTGRGGTVLPNDPLPTIEEVARAYDIRWLALERDDAVASVAPVLLEDRRPSWIGPATWRDDDRAALFPVCTRPGDARCST